MVPLSGKSNLKILYLIYMRLFYCIITLLIVLTASAQNPLLYKKKKFIYRKESINYRILYPAGYNLHKRYPVILFLHGAAQRGSDNERQLEYGSGFFADSVNRAKYPSFVIFPQCPESGFWAKLKREEIPPTDSLGGFTFISTGTPNKSLELVDKLIDSFSHNRHVNPKQIYIGGLSMGGMATFEMLWRKPHFFAAGFTICGGGDPQKVSTYAKNFPVWVFHGVSDPIVPVGNSRLMVNSLNAAGANVKYSEYAGVGHNSWPNAFAEPEFLEWVFTKKLK
jgi:predicted peptidase